MTENSLIKKESFTPPQTSIGESLFFNIQKFEHAQRVAKLLASSTMMPDHFRDNIGNIMIMLNYADRIGADPFMLAQNMCVIHGKPGLEGKLIIGLINSCGRFDPIEFEEFGQLSRPENDEDGCVAYTKDLRSGKVLRGPKIDWHMVKSEGWYGKNGSKWKTGLAPLMFRYRSAAYFGRIYCPDVLLGMQTREELMDVIEMTGRDGRYTPVQEAIETLSEKPVYKIQSAAELTKSPEPPQHDTQQKTASSNVEKQELPEKKQDYIGGFLVGDTAYYKLGMGIGWKQVRVMGLDGDEAVVKFAEDYEYNGKQMRGVISKKPVSDLRKEIPKPISRDEFINLRTGFTKEYLESIRERVEETEDPRVVADLINKAKKFFGDGYSVPGTPLTVHGDAAAESGETEVQVWTGDPDDPIGLDPTHRDIKKINAMINERGMDREGVNLAMREFVLHLKESQPIKPFDVGSTKDIKAGHVMYFGKMLDEIQPKHNIMVMIKDLEKRVRGIETLTKQKLAEHPHPVNVSHWYLIPPSTINKIKLNIDDWAKELLEQSRPEEKF